MVGQGHALPLLPKDDCFRAATEGSGYKKGSVYKHGRQGAHSVFQAATVRQRYLTFTPFPRRDR
jgi:hypothetical protein